MIISNEGNIMTLIVILIIIGIGLIYLYPWYRIMRNHYDPYNPADFRAESSYKTAVMAAKAEVTITLLAIFVYYFDKIDIPWYIIEQADPMEIAICFIMSLVGSIVIACAIRSTMNKNERWFVVTAVLAILMLAWCETLIPWAH